MSPRHFVPLAAAVGGLLLLGGCRQKSATDNTAANITSAQDIVATYAYTDAVFAETVALRPDGQYVQGETFPRGAVFPRAITLSGHKGTWRLLDKPGGSPLTLPAYLSLQPPDAVVELDKAMPFGRVYETRITNGYAPRTIPVREFTLKTTPR